MAVGFDGMFDVDESEFGEIVEHVGDDGFERGFRHVSAVVVDREAAEDCCDLGGFLRLALWLLRFRCR